MVNQATNIRLFFEVTTLTPFFSQPLLVRRPSFLSYNRPHIPSSMHSLALARTPTRPTIAPALPILPAVSPLPEKFPTIQTPFKLIARIAQKKPPLFENTVGVLVYLKSFLISSFISSSGIFSN